MNSAISYCGTLETCINLLGLSFSNQDNATEMCDVTSFLYEISSN